MTTIQAPKRIVHAHGDNNKETKPDPEKKNKQLPARVFVLSETKAIIAATTTYRKHATTNPKK